MKTKIPKKDSAGYVFYKYTNNIIPQLKLSNIKEGYDSLKVRIWILNSSNFQEMYEFSKSHRKCHAFYYSYFVNPIKNSLFAKVNKLKIDTLSSITEPEMFIAKLKYLGIDTLQFQDKIELSDYLVDGVTYCFEYADKSDYNFYVASNPKEYSSKYKQAKVVMKILGLAENEFSIIKRRTSRLKTQ